MEKGMSADLSRYRLAAAWLALGLLAITTTGCSHDAPRQAEPEPEAIARVPFSVNETGLPTVDARIDGASVRLFIDTGGYKPIALKQDVIQHLGLSYDNGSGSANDAQGQIYRTRSLTVKHFQAGSLVLSPAHGADLPALATHAYPQDGYLGYGVLKNHILVIDYAKGELRMYAPAGGNVVLDHECGGDTFDFDIKNAVIQAKVETDAGLRVFQFDTGANRNIVRPASIAPATQEIGAEVTFKRFHLGSVKLGPMSFRVIPYRAPDVDGVLGREFFAAHRVCLDLSSGKGAIGNP